MALRIPRRREADECRQMAARATNSQDKAAWLKLASDWLSLAEKARFGQNNMH